MGKIFNMAVDDIIYYIKLSCQIPSILEAIASQRIIAETVEKVGLTIEVEELQQAADSIRFTNKLLRSEDTWAWLEKHYLSLDDFEEIAKANIMSAKLANHLFADKVEPYFYANQIDYYGVATYEVVLDDEDLALELFYALQEDEISFQEVARQYIQNPEIRRAGGYQGIRRRSDFRPEIAAVVFAATPPQILKPIVTPKGVHIIAVEEIIKPQLDEQLRVQIMGEFFTNWLQQQVATIEIVAKQENNTNSPLSQDLLKPA